MKFHCKICDQNFKRFFLFEGHFDFNEKCREKQELFLQCYICCDMFRNSAGLKYHMHQHTIKRAKRLTPIKLPKLRELRPVIPKITLEKQWNFKTVTEEEKDADMKKGERPQLECRICGEKFEKRYDWEKHSKEHEAVQEPVNTSQTVSASTSTVKNSESTEKILSVPNGISKSNTPSRRQCSVCKIVLKHGGKRLARHMQGHIDGKYKCEICNIKFSKNSLVWHRIYFHKGIWKQLLTKKMKQKVGGNNDLKNGRCKICQAVVKRGDVPQHMEGHRSGKFRCGICNIRFSKGSYRWHRRSFHPEIINEIKGKCTICKIVLADRNSLRNHLKVHEFGEVKCDLCDIRFTPQSLLLHQRRVHPDIPQLLSVQQKCDVCHAICRSKAALDAHDDMHANGEHECGVHKIKFTFEALQVHNNRWHRKQRVTCPICKVGFANSYRLERHKRVHVIGSVICEICDIIFTKNSLIHHQKVVHPELYYGVIRSERRNRKGVSPNNNKFQCQYCNLRCDDAKKLEIHTAVHIDGNVECRICKVTFTKNSLSYHERHFHKDEIRKERILKALHRHLSDELQGRNDLEAQDIPAILEEKYKQLSAGKSKYDCIICNLPCNEGAKLDQHITVHIEGDYKCDLCPVPVWFTKNSLEFHQKRFHLEFYEERISNGIRLTKENCGEGNKNEFSEKKSPKSWNPKCDICKVSVGSADRMAQHKQTHIDGEVECKKCNIRFTVNALRHHQKTYHSHNISTELLKKALERNMVEISTNAHEKKNQCPICKVKCEGKKFDAHMKVHINGDVQCSVCQIWFTQLSLDYHYRRFHPHLYVAKENRTDIQLHQCHVCKLVSSDETKLNEHMKVHAGNLKCPICKIPFTKASLVRHYKKIHPNLAKEERILKPIENSVLKKNLSCPKCGKTFTRKCYLNLHLKNHRNAVNPVEIPFPEAKTEPVEQLPSPILSSPLSVEQNPHSVNQSATVVKRRQYECYVCKEPLYRAYELQDHVARHVVYEQWVDPSDVYLSNWDADELSEIISEQPLVLVQNLDVRTINMKMLADVDRSTKNPIDKHDVNENLSEMARQNTPTIMKDTPDTTQNDCVDVVEILSDDDDDDDNETIRYQLYSKSPVPVEVMDNDTDEPVYISSDEDEDRDITNTFYCYYCNGQFVSLAQLGEHGEICHMKS